MVLVFNVITMIECVILQEIGPDVTRHFDGSCVLHMVGSII